MEITRETKLSDLIGWYPWLREELSKVNDKFKMLNTPMGKIMMGSKRRPLILIFCLKISNMNCNNRVSYMDGQTTAALMNGIMRKTHH